MTLKAKMGVYKGFLAISGCDSSVAFASCQHTIFSQYWWNSCIGYGARRHLPWSLNETFLWT